MSGARADQLATFCPMCVSRCGATATVVDGRLAAIGPDPAHPTGRAVCVKGKAAPHVLEHPDRLLHPLRRTNPKGAADPGWQQIGWDEALDAIASRLREIADESGPEAVVFGSASPSTSALSDSVDWITRLRRAFGSPNFTCSMELCGWGRFLASMYTFGAPVPGAFMPDLDNAGCILYWGYNPSVSRLVHATATVDAVNRGARLVVVDPRRTGLVSKAEHWLQVRPGTDAALALALVHVMLEQVLVRRGLRPSLDQRPTPAADRHRAAAPRGRAGGARRPVGIRGVGPAGGRARRLRPGRTVVRRPRVRAGAVGHGRGGHGRTVGSAAARFSSICACTARR